MGRRDFLRMLGATAAVAASAPVLEHLLWTPSTSIVVPSLPYIDVAFTQADLLPDDEFMRRILVPAMKAISERIDADIAAMAQRDLVFFDGDVWPRSHVLRKA